MKPFSAPRRRLVSIRSGVAGLPDTDWIVTYGARGLAVKRRGARDCEARGATWRQVIGMLLVSGRTPT